MKNCIIKLREMMRMWIDKTEIEKRAIDERKNIQTYGVKDIFSVIRQKDIQLIRYPFGKDTILGFATLFEGKKVIVSNSSEILSREIFTIAHELGHVIYDLKDSTSNVRIDVDMQENSEDIAEKRAFHFANCFLMPEEELRKFIKYELRKKLHELNAFDIVRMQLEFQVSYAALLVRLYELELISASQKSKLFDKRDAMTLKALFNKLDAEEKLLKPSSFIEVPPNYLEFITSNYENKYIPYSSLEKGLSLIGMDSSSFKEELPNHENEENLDIDDIFEEFEE